MIYSGFYIFYFQDISMTKTQFKQKKWISSRGWFASIWKKGLGNKHFFVCFSHPSRVWWSFSFPELSHTEDVSSSTPGLARTTFADIIASDSSGSWGKKHFLHFLIFFLLTKAAECPCFSHLSLSSTCLRNPLGAPVWGDIIYSKNICNANIHRLTWE